MIFQRYNQVMYVVTSFSNQLVPLMNALKSLGFISKFQGLFVSAIRFVVIQPTSFVYFSQTSICQWPFLVVWWGRPLTYGWACAFLIMFRPHITHERRSPPTSPPRLVALVFFCLWFTIASISLTANRARTTDIVRLLRLSSWFFAIHWYYSTLSNFFLYNMCIM